MGNYKTCNFDQTTLNSKIIVLLYLVFDPFAQKQQQLLKCVEKATHMNNYVPVRPISSSGEAVEKWFTLSEEADETHQLLTH